MNNLLHELGVRRLAESGAVELVNLTGAVDRLRMAKGTVRRLIDLDALVRVGIDDEFRVAIPADGDRQRILDDFVARHPTMTDDRSFNLYRTVFKALDRVEHRSEIMSIAREFLVSEGIAISPLEVAGLIGGREQLVSFFKETTERRKGYRSVSAVTGGAGSAATETIEQVVERMELGTHVARGTAADPKFRGQYDTLTAEHCRGLLAIGNGSLFRVVALHVMIRIMDDVAPQTISRLIGHAHRLDAVLSGIDITSTSQMAKRLEDYVIEKSVLPDDSDHIRAAHVYTLYHIWETVNDWIDLIPQEHTRKFFQTMSFSLPRRGSRIIKALTGMERSRKHNTKKTRKMRSDRLVAGFDLTRHLVEVRHNQVRRMHEAFRSVCRRLDNLDDVDLARSLPYEFWYEEHVPATSERQAADQTVILRITTRAHLVREMLARPGPFDHELSKAASGGQRYREEDERDYLLEYVDTRPTVAGAPVTPIWWAEIARSCVYFNPAVLSPEHASDRRGMLRELELSAKGAERSVLLIGHGSRADHTLIYRAFAEMGRLYIPIENAFLTTSLARIPIRVTTTNGARASEVMQMAYDEELWGTIVDKKSRVELDFFEAIPKGKRKRHVFFVDPETMDAVTALVDYLSSRYYADGELPVINPSNWMKGKQTETGTLQPARFIMQWAGAMLDHAEFVTCQRVLLQGETAYLPHDERHAFATVARQEGMEADVLRKVMHHERPDETAYYSDPTMEETAESVASFIAKRHEAATLIATAEETLGDEELDDFSKIGGLHKMPGGHCYRSAPCQHNMTACVGCSHNRSEPRFRHEIMMLKRRAEEALRDAEEHGFTQFAAQERKRLEDAEAMLREMDLVEKSRADGQSTTAVRLGRPGLERQVGPKSERKKRNA